MVDNRNKIAHKARKKQGVYSRSIECKKKEIMRWIDTNMKEFYTFFGIYIYGGRHPKLCLIDYWQVNKDGNYNQVKNAISLNCFEQINRFFLYF